MKTREELLKEVWREINQNMSIPVPYNEFRAIESSVRQDLTPEEHAAFALGWILSYRLYNWSVIESK